jgi:ABC-type sugar transport system, ATPase component
MNSYLKIDSLNIKSNNKYILKNISFELFKNNITALTSKNNLIIDLFIKALKKEINPVTGTIFFEPENIFFISSKIYPTSFLTVAENVFLGNEIKKLGFINKKAQNKKVTDVLNFFDINLDVNSFPDNNTFISLLINLIKAFIFNFKFIMIDTRNIFLSDENLKNLHNILKKLKENDFNIIFISQSFTEISLLSDEVLILNKDSAIKIPTAEISSDTLPKILAGNNNILTDKPDSIFSKDKTVLRIKNLFLSSVINNVSFSVYKGEILGITGFSASGANLTSHAFLHLINEAKGTTSFGNTILKKPEKAAENGILFLSKNDSVKLLKKYPEFYFSSRQNKSEKLRQLFWFDSGKNSPPFYSYLKEALSSNKKEFDINSLINIIFSGLSKLPRVVILDEPFETLKSSQEEELLISNISRLNENGIAVIIDSDNFKKIAQLCSRTLIFYKGNINKSLTGKNITEANIIKYALGISDD